MALYSEIIDTDSKWMWSSITTGGISLLFLAGAFWGLSTSMNKTSALLTNHQVTYTQPVLPKSIAPKISTKITPKKTLAIAQDQKVNRAAKQNSTFITPPLAKLTSKPKANTNTNTSIKPIIASPIAIATNSGNKTPTPLLTSNSLRQQSNLSQKTLSQTQLASLNLRRSEPRLSPASNQATSVDPAKIGPFKIIDVNVKVKKGDTLLKILKQNGATSTEAQNIVNKLKPHLKINELEIGQPLTLTLNRRTNNDSIHPIKLIIPLGYRATKPDAVLKDRISISYDEQNKLALQLPTDNLSTITMRPAKPLKAPQFTPAPPRALDNKSTASLSQKIASLTQADKGKVTAGSRQAFYRTRSWVKGSFKKTIAAQGVPSDVQSRLLSVYNQTAKTKAVKSGDILEVFYDQTESKTGKLQKLGKLLYVNFKANGKVYTYYRFGSQFYDSNGKSINKGSSGGTGGGGFMAQPLPGAKMTSKFGMRRHPVYRRWKMHSGTDFAAPRGTPIYAAASGKVTIAKWYGGAGRYVQINHGNGYTSGYMHMTRFAKGMKPGKSVNRGQIIGYVGSTGTATGNHLHFEVTKNKKKINPMTVIGKGRAVASTSSGKLSGNLLKKFKAEKSRITRLLNKTSATEKIAKR